MGSRSIRVSSIDLTLSDLEGRDASGRTFLADHRYTRVVWPRMTKFGSVTQVVEKRVSRGQPRPHHQKVGTLYLRPDGPPYEEEI